MNCDGCVYAFPAMSDADSEWNFVAGMDTYNWDEGFGIEYRQEKKKPLSPLALKKTQNLMLKYGYEQSQHMVDAAILNDWQGLHPVDPPKQISTKQTSLHDDLTDTSWAN